MDVHSTLPVDDLLDCVVGGISYSQTSTSGFRRPPPGRSRGGGGGGGGSHAQFSKASVTSTAQYPIAAAHVSHHASAGYHPRVASGSGVFASTGAASSVGVGGRDTRALQQQQERDDAQHAINAQAAAAAAELIQLASSPPYSGGGVRLVAVSSPPKKKTAEVAAAAGGDPVGTSPLGFLPPQQPPQQQSHQQLPDAQHRHLASRIATLEAELRSEQDARRSLESALEVEREGRRSERAKIAQLTVLLGRGGGVGHPMDASEPAGVLLEDTGDDDEGGGSFSEDDATLSFLGDLDVSELPLPLPQPLPAPARAGAPTPHSAQLQLQSQQRLQPSYDDHPPALPPPPASRNLGFDTQPVTDTETASVPERAPPTPPPPPRSAAEDVGAGAGATCRVFDLTTHPSAFEAPAGFLTRNTALALRPPLRVQGSAKVFDLLPNKHPLRVFLYVDAGSAPLLLNTSEAAAEVTINAPSGAAVTLVLPTMSCVAVDADLPVPDELKGCSTIVAMSLHKE